MVVSLVARAAAVALASPMGVLGVEIREGISVSVEREEHIAWYRLAVAIAARNQVSMGV